MGLIYHPTESQGLVSALNANIATAQEMIDKLNQASQHLIEALNGKELSGAAYTAGKGMFSELILPTISKASEALEKVKSDGKQYEGFASSAGSEILDEDKLNEQLETLRTQQSALSSQISFYNQQAAIHPENSELNTSYGDFSTQLSSYMGTNAHDIQKVQEKLQKLHEFNTHVSTLFTASANDFKTAMDMVFAFGLAEFDKTGNFILKVANSKDMKRLEHLAGELGNKVSDKKEWFNESLSQFLDSVADKVIKEGKNIGRSWGAKLQPHGTGGIGFVKDNFAPRRWLSGKLKGVSNPVSKVIGTGAKWGSKLLVGLGAVENYNEYNAEYHNGGRAMVYSGVSTAASYWAGGIGASVGTAAAGFAVSSGMIAGGTALAAVATVALPVAGAIVVGAAAGMAVKALYDNVKPVRDVINGAGDFLNDAGNNIKNTAKEVGKALNNPLKSLKGAFGW
ncbi:hypothetical protein IAE51_10320 [Lactococcus sp. S64]|uniref:hypothetical protein n=1 Tax=Lactococcus sp. S64 TaxID=2767459 RepID=UPI001905DFB1|nr:hypothetical protein [Lactococcus sp. S64]MBK0084291.1 hypothetical protein [Lactococcus sp. S64]